MRFAAGFKLDLLFLVLIAFTLPIFFYKLGQSSLSSWDEAWYGEISRNILKTNDLLNLTWNGKPYSDHPPFGFWMIAVGEKILGVSELGVRAAPALAGFLSLFVIYFLGKELFGRNVGLMSSFGLASSFWFLYRARSGNLDAFLTLLFLLSFFLALKAVKEKLFLWPFVISIGLLFLTKTLVPLTILPSLVIIFWKVRIYSKKEILLASLLFLLVTGPWFLVQFLSHDNFWSRYLMIGLPEAKIATSYWDNFNQFREYLHSGVGKWFWPGISALILSTFFGQKRFYVLSIFFLIFFIPFLFSPKGQIWHLIPLHPILILSFLGFLYVLLDKIFKARFATLAVLLLGFYISFLQIRQGFYQFIDIPAYISDEAILSKEAGRYSERFFIDGGDFGPAAVFYSGKTVQKIWEGGLQDLFRDYSSFVLITHQWRLDKVNIPKDQYQILKTDRDKILVKRLKGP